MRGYTILLPAWDVLLPLEYTTDRRDQWLIRYTVVSLQKEPGKVESIKLPKFRRAAGESLSYSTAAATCM